VPFDTPPVLLSVDEVRKSLVRETPEEVLASGEGRRVALWLQVDTEGRVSRSEIRVSSGLEEVDRAGLRVSMEMRFAPAQNRGRNLGVWVEQWLTFGLP